MRTIYAAIAAMIGLIILAGTGMAKEDCKACEEKYALKDIPSDLFGGLITGPIGATLKYCHTTKICKQCCKTVCVKHGKKGTCQKRVKSCTACNCRSKTTCV